MVVDAVAVDKARRCQAEGIALELRLALPQDLPLDGPTLCSVFANLLDNAMEACLRLPAEARQITCSAVCRGGYLIVQERNPLPPPRMPKRGGDGAQTGVALVWKFWSRSPAAMMAWRRSAGRTDSSRSPSG